jgi:hypothetical protein
MIQIFDKMYSDLKPVMPTMNALVVFDIDHARLAFSHGRVDFVIVLDKLSGTFRYCYNIADVTHFLYGPLE